MKNLVKYILSLLIIFFIAVACSKTVEKITTTDDKKREKYIRDSLDAIKEDQYIMAETFTGDRTQMVDLIKGPATFDIVHEGSGHFRAVLTTIDGKELLVLADVDGNYKGQKTYDAPETTGYLIDVTTTGTWMIKRK